MESVIQSVLAVKMAQACGNSRMEMTQFVGEITLNAGAKARTAIADTEVR